jgi:hypothetical protein
VVDDARHWRLGKGAQHTEQMDDKFICMNFIKTVRQTDHHAAFHAQAREKFKP